jgi:hypothetical protein
MFKLFTKSETRFEPFDNITLQKAAAHNANSYSGPLVYAARETKLGIEVYIPGFPRQNDYFPPKTTYPNSDIQTALTLFDKSIRID